MSEARTDLALESGALEQGDRWKGWRPGRRRRRAGR